MKVVLHLLKRPFVYLFAFVMATLDAMQKEQKYSFIIDGLDIDIRFFSMADVPVLMFCDKNRPLPNFLVGCEIDKDAMRSLLDTCWKQYREEQLDNEEHNYSCTVKPDFLRTFRYIVHQERLEQEEVQRIQQEARNRAEEVRKWLDAGADINATVQQVNDRRFNCQVGCTALKLAQLYHEQWIVRLLVIRGSKH